MLTPSPSGARWPEPEPLANPGRFRSRRRVCGKRGPTLVEVVDRFAAQAQQNVNGGVVRVVIATGAGPATQRTAIEALGQVAVEATSAIAARSVTQPAVQDDGREPVVSQALGKVPRGGRLTGAPDSFHGDEIAAAGREMVSGHG